MTIAISAFLLSIVVTLIVLQGYGVNFGNWQVFARLARLKRNNAKRDETGEEIYNYVIKCLGSEKRGRLDITFTQILTEAMFEDAISVAISKLLENGYKPVSLDRSDNRIVIIIG